MLVLEELDRGKKNKTVRDAIRWMDITTETKDLDRIEIQRWKDMHQFDPELGKEWNKLSNTEKYKWRNGVGAPGRLCLMQFFTHITGRFVLWQTVQNSSRRKLEDEQMGTPHTASISWFLRIWIYNLFTA